MQARHQMPLMTTMAKSTIARGMDQAGITEIITTITPPTTRGKDTTAPAPIIGAATAIMIAITGITAVDMAEDMVAVDTAVGDMAAINSGQLTLPKI